MSASGRTHRWLASLLVLGTLAMPGCDRGEKGKKAVSEPPARVENRGLEADLTTVHLTARAEERLGIEVEQIRRQAVPRTRTYGGEMLVPAGRSIVVSAPVAGSLMSPASGAVPSPGSPVRQGQEVFRLLPLATPESDLLRLEKEAEARLEAARLRASRSEQLYKDRAGSARQLEEAQADLAIAEATSRSLRTQLDLLNRTTVDGKEGGISALAMVSPLHGRLGRVHVAEGQAVSGAAVLFEVIREDVLWIRVAVYVGDLESIDRAADTLVHPLGRPATEAALTATPVAAPPSGDAEAGTIDLFFEFRNSGGVYQPGQRIGVTLQLLGSEEDLVVPRSALLYDIHGGTWVYERTEPRTFVRRRVEVTRVAGSLAVLARAPEPGTSVVITGAAELFGTEFGVGK